MINNNYKMYSSNLNNIDFFNDNIFIGGEDSIPIDQQLVQPTDQPLVQLTNKPTNQPTIQNKYLNIVSSINQKYKDFKKSLYDFAKGQNLLESELYVLLPSNDDPYIDQSTIDNLLFKKLSTTSIYVGKNGNIIDGQTPFYNPTLKINS
jgi:hypothetical protein